ncbi:MAG: dihydrolipoyl dehydrogenase [Promethearchaeota archaeon]
MMTGESDVVVVGGGPGGYPAAIRASQLGKKVTLIEMNRVGGECLNLGCIPSKALLSATKFFHQIKDKAPIMGISTGKVSINMSKLHDWRTGVQETLVGGVTQLLKANGVEILEGIARFKDHQQLDITLNAGGERTISARNIILATGATFYPPPDLGFDGSRILSPYQALSVKKPPKTTLVVGAGDLGFELATLMNRLDAKVTLVGSTSDLLAELDPRIVALVKKNLRQSDIDLMLDVKVSGIDATDDTGTTVTLTSTSGKVSVLTVDSVIFTTGKQPNTAELGLNEIGVKTSSDGAIIVDDLQRTNVDHLYAVGDCTGPPFIAQRATKQGIVAAEVVAGLPSAFDFRAMPRVIFTDPEIAFVGMSEADAKAAGYMVISGKAPFSASGRALTEVETSGMVQIIADENSGALLGAQLVGPRVTDLISEMSLALEMGALLEDLSYTTHPHPTLPEMLMEASASAQGKAINVGNSRKNK